MVDKRDRILVIKLGALGDFIQATGAMKAIRTHHDNAHITVLTTKPFQKFAEKCGYFDKIVIDQKPKWYQPFAWLKLCKILNDLNPVRVYDLQNNDRTSFYYKLFSKKPEWSGIAKGASHRNISKDRTQGHAFDGHKQTLGIAGIKTVDVDPLDWISSDLSAFKLNKPYVLFVPGSAPTRPEKRWPTEHYAELADNIIKKGYQVVLLGTAAEASVTERISALCPEIYDLTAQTSLFDIVTLGRTAAATIGNDTGPMHMIAPTGCPCITLFSAHSNPKRHYPKGPNSQTIYAQKLNELDVQAVLNAFQDLELERAS